MESRYFFPSLTRISDLARRAFGVEKLPREQWGGGDYVAAAVTGTRQGKLELAHGRMIDVMEGDHLIGALGKRAATLQGVGDWQAIGEDLEMDALTAAGLIGKVTSASHLADTFTRLSYVGHVMREGRKLGMEDFVEPLVEKALNVPVILLVGTSMSAGKTTTGRVIIHELTRAGLKVVGAKLTGAGRYRDILAFKDAGADHIFDFVDVGLPSTVVPEGTFRRALRTLLHRIAHLEPDVLVAEAGASPLEPYNGATAIEELKGQICCTILSASDPYAVVGVQTAFGLQPDLVTGPATNTEAGIALVNKLARVKALNIMDRACLPALRELLRKRLPKGML